MKNLLFLSLIFLSACTNPQNILFENPCEHTDNNWNETRTISVSETAALRIASNFLNKNATRNASLTAEVFTINDSLDYPLMYG